MPGFTDNKFVSTEDSAIVSACSSKLEQSFIIAWLLDIWLLRVLFSRIANIIDYFAFDLLVEMFKANLIFIRCPNLRSSIFFRSNELWPTPKPV